MVPRSQLKLWLRLVHIFVVLVVAWNFGRIDAALRHGAGAASGGSVTTMTYADFERRSPPAGRYRLTGCSTYALAASCDAPLTESTVG